MTDWLHTVDASTRNKILCSPFFRRLAFEHKLIFIRMFAWHELDESSNIGLAKYLKRTNFAFYIHLFNISPILCSVSTV